MIYRIDCPARAIIKNGFTEDETFSIISNLILSDSPVLVTNGDTGELLLIYEDQLDNGSLSMTYIESDFAKKIFKRTSIMDMYIGASL